MIIHCIRLLYLYTFVILSTSFSVVYDMSYDIVRVTENLQLGEGPHWDEETQSLYFVDIRGKSVHKYTPSTNLHYKAVIGEKNVSFIIPVDGSQNKFVIGYGNELAVITWDGKSEKVSHFESIVELENDVIRWNDGKVDSTGKLWAGIMFPKPEGGFYTKKGILYTLQADKTLKKQADQITLSNGLAWDDKINKFYYIDSLEQVIYQFDYDRNSCEISNQEIIFSFPKNNISGSPDGMTIDTDGNLWIACFGGSSIIKIDPRKPEKLLQTVEIPAIEVTSVAFGGPNYAEMYVTTANINAFGVTPEGPQHGITYKITGLGVKGLPPNKVKL